MREVNDRATKEFLYRLAKQAGYDLDFQRVGAKTWNNSAERLTVDNDPSLAVNVFQKITTPSRAIALRDEHIKDAVKRFPGCKKLRTRWKLRSARATLSTIPLRGVCFPRKCSFNCSNG